MSAGGKQSKLEYETTWQYETGIYHRFAEGIDNRFIIYYSDITDYVTIDRADLLHNITTSSGWNVDTVRFWGIEYEFNIAYKKLTAFGNYTYIDNEVIEDDPAKTESFMVELPPKHKINLGFRYRLSDSLQFTCDQRYVGRRYSEAGRTLSEYITSDVGLQYSFYKNKAKLNAFINNLFGENYEQTYGYPMSRQMFGLTFKYTFF
ncbi:MAG: outer membrane beta-barrel protein [Proteobacteria bacterium]|nr:outer membrane beta-barrel protein [Pseudomonadota bacterium]MBU4009683.1 outer membrane beta-barrel protein [Pseudomonadota bacterium]